MLKKWLYDVKGQALVLTAFTLLILIGVTGLVIDGGRVYLAKSQLQKAADAGALAGADLLIDEKETTANFNYDAAESKANEISVLNHGKDDSNITYTADISPKDPDKNEKIVEVDGTEKVSFTLMRALGINDTVIHAAAEVKIGKITRADKGAIIPIGIQFETAAKLVPGEEIDLTENPGEGVMGNYNLLDFSSLDGVTGSHGADSVGDYIEKGSPVPISVSEEIYPKTGAEIKSTPIKTAIGKRVGDIVYIPIITSFGPGKSQPVTVLGFTAFQILPLPDDEKTIRGKFIKQAVPGEIGDVPEDNVPFVSKLVM